MKLFHWTSEVLADYGQGDILVMATDVETAREKARQANRKRLRWYEGHVYDEEDIRYGMKKFEADISKEPEIIESGVLLIPGSA